MKNREKKVLKTMCFFDIDFSSLFCDFSRFWVDFGRPRDLQKSIKKLKKSCSERFWSTLGIFDRIWEGSGRVLGRFWEDFDRFLDGFWMDFWRFWQGLGFPGPKRQQIVKKGKTMIRATK